jgi:hypothetical protein
MCSCGQYAFLSSSFSHLSAWCMQKTIQCGILKKSKKRFPVRERSFPPGSFCSPRFGCTRYSSRSSNLMPATFRPHVPILPIRRLRKGAPSSEASWQSTAYSAAIRGHGTTMESTTESPGCPGEDTNSSTPRSESGRRPPFSHSYNIHPPTLIHNF